MLIPCDAPLAKVVSAYLEAGDLTPSSRATYRRVLGELARDLSPRRPANTITGDELAAWFVRTRDAYAPATWNRDRVIVRSFIRALQAQAAPLDPPVIGYRRLRPVGTRALTRAEVARILGLPVALREKTLCCGRWPTTAPPRERAARPGRGRAGPGQPARRGDLQGRRGSGSPGVRAWPGCCRAC